MLLRSYSRISGLTSLDSETGSSGRAAPISAFSRCSCAGLR
ncbi:hypothetical protein ACFQU2_08650 [Siccirubricoccus deserti]